MASTRRIVSFSIWKAFSSQPDMMMPENAPTLMKPACPSDSSPEMPTVRFSETAMTM